MGSMMGTTDMGSMMGAVTMGSMMGSTDLDAMHTAMHEQLRTTMPG